MQCDETACSTAEASKFKLVHSLILTACLISEANGHWSALRENVKILDCIYLPPSSDCIYILQHADFANFLWLFCYTYVYVTMKVDNKTNQVAGRFNGWSWPTQTALGNASQTWRIRDVNRWRCLKVGDELLHLLTAKHLWPRVVCLLKARGLGAIGTPPIVGVWTEAKWFRSRYCIGLQ